MPFLFSLRTWLLATLLWAAAIGARCWQQWPHVPLDVSANDPATAQAFNHAVTNHALFHAALAAVPPLVVLLIGRFLLGARR